jgi:hypothetical protein
MSLRCGHQRAYCSSPRRYMSMESYDEMILTEKNQRTRRKTCPRATLFTTNPTFVGCCRRPGQRVASISSTASCSSLCHNQEDQNRDRMKNVLLHYPANKSRMLSLCHHVCLLLLKCNINNVTENEEGNTFFSIYFASVSLHTAPND